MLGVEALHSSSEKVKTCQEVKEVSFRKSSLAFFIVAEDEVEGCSFLVEG